MPVMDCLRTQELLGPLLDGELPVDVAGPVLAHLDACAGCRAQQAALRALGTAVRAIAEPSPAGLSARILSEAHAIRRPVLGLVARAAGWWPRAAATLVGAAAGMLLLPVAMSPDVTRSIEPGSPYRLLVAESQGQIELAGSLREDFLALAMSPESRLLHHLIDGAGVAGALGSGGR